jgi:hypothetical protein
MAVTAMFLAQLKIYLSFNLHLTCLGIIGLRKTQFIYKNIFLGREVNETKV